MTVSAHLLLWCPVQVTVLAVAALALDAVIGRRRPAAGALVAAAALVAVVGLSAAALSPWPSWPVTWDRLPWRSLSAASDSPADGAAEDALLNTRLPGDGDGKATDGLPQYRTAGAFPPSGSFARRIWNFVADHWPALVALLYLAGVGVMAIRFGLGLVAVRGYRRHSRPLRDRRLARLLALVREQLGESRVIELRESADLGTPATIGWQRPILLLPRDWPQWTVDECRAVLAHEVEHIRRNDFSSWIIAQIGLALHFYHPLVHSLAGRLRLKQELAADAAAARIVGGQRKYVATLAAMALRQSDGFVAWPARAFLPTSNTFLRRIEMLHRLKSLRSDVSRPLFFASLTAVVLAAVCAAGLRASSANEDGKTAAGSIVLAASEDPHEVRAADSGQKRRASLNHLKQLVLAMHNYHSTHQHFPPAAVMGPDGKTPHSWRVELLPFLEENALYDKYRMNEPWDSPDNKKVLEQMPDVLRSPYDDPKSTNSGFYVLAGPGTIFDGAEGMPIRKITDGTTNTLIIVESKQNIPWTRPEDIPFDPDKPLPTIGGFVKDHFDAAAADGSARRFDANKVKDQLKWLIMRNDGHQIDTEKLAPRDRPAP